MGIRDTRLMERALRERWPIKPEYREKIIASLLLIVADRNASPRERTSAAKALLAADAQNQADEHKLIDVHVTTRHDQLASIAADLGIEIGAIEDATRKADSSIGGIVHAEHADSDGARTRLREET